MHCAEAREHVASSPARLNWTTQKSTWSAQTAGHRHGALEGRLRDAPLKGRPGAAEVTGAVVRGDCPRLPEEALPPSPNCDSSCFGNADLFPR